MAWGFLLSAATSPLYIGVLRVQVRVYIRTFSISSASDFHLSFRLRAIAYCSKASSQVGAEILPLMSWVLLLISAIQGIFISALSMRHEMAVNITFSAIFGVYAGLLVVASLGYEFTAGVLIIG